MAIYRDDQELQRPRPQVRPAPPPSFNSPVGPPPTGGINPGGQVQPVPNQGAQNASSVARQVATAPAAQPFNRTQFRDQWMAKGRGADVGALQQFLQPYNLQADASGRVRLPTGETIDMLNNAHLGGQGAIWSGVPGATTKIGQTPGAGGGGGAGATGGAAGGAGGGGFSDQIRQLILSRLGGAMAPVSASDPAIQQQFAPQAAQLERAAQQQRAALAERAAFQGLNAGGAGSGAFDTGIQGIIENTGLQRANLLGGLIGNELQGRRAEVQNLLQMAMASGDAESARALQMQLAQMDADLRRQGLSQQQSQFNDTLDFNWAQFQTDLL